MPQNFDKGMICTLSLEEEKNRLPFGQTNESQPSEVEDLHAQPPTSPITLPVNPKTHTMQGL